MSQGQFLLCRITTGDLHARKVLETERMVAVMNTFEPQARGHVVLFPKRHAVGLHDMDDQDLGAILAVAKKVASVLQLENYNILHNHGALAGQTVFHAHFHLIPKWSESEGLRYTWEVGKDYDQEQLYRKAKEALSSKAG